MIATSTLFSEKMPLKSLILSEKCQLHIPTAQDEVFRLLIHVLTLSKTKRYPILIILNKEKQLIHTSEKLEPDNV